ncbi:MAG: helix-turn-helix domain-containing protein [Chloroflexota bacterium]|nr:helix-turn-helix domain-containing protein [Chloroflexota bacterium]
MAQEAQAPPSERLLVKIPEAAEILSISKSKLYALIRRREIATVRFDGAVRVPLAELREMVAARVDPAQREE